MHRTLVRLLVGLAASAVVVAGLTASSASARQAADKGNTRVAVAPRVAKIITAAGISATPTGGAKASAFQGTVALRFAISGTAGGGNRILHSGGVRLSAGEASIALGRFRINLNQGKVSARVNGDARAKLFKIVKSNRPELGAVRLVFNSTSAGALNSTFGVDVFKSGANFAFATVRAR